MLYKVELTESAKYSDFSYNITEIKAFSENGELVESSQVRTIIST